MDKDKDRELMHRLLDGELSAEEQRDALRRIGSDPALKEEFELLARTVRSVEEAERVPVEGSFVSEVMARLPGQRPGTARRLRDFLFRDRVLRWNVAWAAVALALVLLVTGGLFLTANRLTPVVATNSAGNTVLTRFTFHDPDAEAVSLAGDFNRWSVKEGAMKRKEGGLWTIEIPLKPGTYNYMFVVDGKVWVTDPEAGVYRDDGFGNRNSIIRVSTL